MALGFCHGAALLLKVPSPIINGLFISANTAPITIHKLQAAYHASKSISRPHYFNPTS